jgi:hypothetical protein
VTSYPRANGNHKDANWRFPKGETQGRCGEVSLISFNNITATGENGCFVGGDVPGKVHDIYFNNVRVNLVQQTAYEHGVFDKRPCKGEGFVRMRWEDLSRMSVPLYTENATVFIPSLEK